jgi:hypothetical protein
MTKSTIPVIWSSDDTTQDAHLVAAAFLARYRGRTLDAYHYDLRGFFAWAGEVGLDVLGATRPHIELYRVEMEERGLAASTIDRRLSTVLWLLPLRPYRWSYRLESGAVCSTPESTAEHSARLRPWRARYVPFHCRAFRPGARGVSGSTRSKRPPGLGSMRNEHRGSRFRARSSHAAHRRKGQQACADPARPTNWANDRSRCRRTSRGADTSPSRRRAARPKNGASMGSFNRPTSRSRVDPPTHASSSLHHGGT